jgi:ribosome biogenesis protein MAK21
VTDKVSALTLLIQESPVHNLEYFRQHLLNMAKKKSRREAILAIDSVKDLLLNNLLPDRKLKLVYSV